MTTGIRNTDYAPPFPYFGGKAPVADQIWEALGNVTNFVEPFCGSAAALFLRPGGTKVPIETINDADGFVSNAWRSIKRDPEGVAEWADEMVSECEVHARHLWLLGQRDSLTDRLCGDVDFYDVRAAGYWIHGLCCWIGSGWCSGQGPWQSVDGVMTNTRTKDNGVWRKRPHLGNTGKGVNRKLPHLGDAGKGECELRRDWLIGYLKQFSDRLRNVRICCGDWSRVCGPSVTFRHGLTGVLCMHPLTPIRMADESVVPVASVTPGMRVHGGRNVKAVMTREHNGELLRLKLQGMPDDLRVTTEHRILRIRKRPPNSRQDVRTNQERWDGRELVPASSIKVGDIVLVPLGGESVAVDWQWSDRLMKRGTRQLQTVFSPTSGIFRLLGYYAAEGCIVWRYGRPGGVQFTFNRNEKDTWVKDTMELCHEIFGVIPTVRLHNPGAINLHIGSTSVAEFFSHYVPGHSLSKRLHPALMTAAKVDQKDLLIGWLRGDGGIAYGSRGRSKLTGTSASDGLARDMMTLALRCGLRPSYKTRRQNRDKPFTCSDIYFASQDAKLLGWSTPAVKDRCSRRIVNGHMLIHVRGVSRESYSGPVYDLDVDGDDLIVAGGILIHNCDPPYSEAAGRDSTLYAVDCEQVAHAVREWAIEQGENPLMRLVLCGYSQEHEMPSSWRMIEWQATGGYGLQGTDEESAGRANRKRERLWCSPHCLKPAQGGLFE